VCVECVVRTGCSSDTSSSGMRVSRLCASWRRYLRPRFGFRTFLVSLAAVYFTAMYVFHTSLDRSPHQQQQRPAGARRWDAGGADDVVMPPAQLQQQQERGGRRRRLPAERLDGDLQAAFDDIRRVEQERRRERGGVADDRRPDDRRPSPALSPGPDPGTAPDANVPASCNATGAVGGGGGGDVDFRALADAYLLSAFWDERPNDFDNRHNGTLVRLMAVARDGAARGLAPLQCDFGGSRRSPTVVYEMCENHHRPYGSYILSCRVPDDVVAAPPPCSVAVVAESATAVDRRVDVPLRTLRPRTTLTHSFSVCVPPLFGDIPPARLVEFFEVTHV